MNRRRGKKFPEDAGAENSEQNLNDARGYPDAERQPVGLKVGGGVLSAGEPEFRHAADGDDDEPRGRAFDGQFGITEKRGQDAADNGGEDAGDGGIPTGQGNAEAQRQRDQKHQKSGQKIGFPVLL